MAGIALELLLLGSDETVKASDETCWLFDAVLASSVGLLEDAAETLGFTEVSMLALGSTAR